MNTVMGVGVGLTLLGSAAYALGVVNPYPGRAFSLTALMVGVTLAAIGRSLDAGESP